VPPWLPSDENDNASEFFKELGGEGQIAEAADDDEAWEKKKAAQLKLYRVRAAR